MEDKKQRILTQILELVEELYPYMDRIILTDLDTPRSIIITSDDAIEEIAAEFGVDPDMLADVSEEIDLMGDDDDDEGGGMLQ